MKALDMMSCKKELTEVGILLKLGGPVYDSIFTLKTDHILFTDMKILMCRFCILHVKYQ